MRKKLLVINFWEKVLTFVLYSIEVWNTDHLEQAYFIQIGHFKCYVYNCYVINKVIWKSLFPHDFVQCRLTIDYQFRDYL